jgi:hypothetical protein
MADTSKLSSAISETSLLRMLPHSQPPFLTEDLERAGNILSMAGEAEGKREKSQELGEIAAYSGFHPNGVSLSWGTRTDGATRIQLD